MFNTSQLPLSPEQQAIFDLVAAGKSVSVKACAGSGKSHTATACVFASDIRCELIPHSRTLSETETEKFKLLPYVNSMNFHRRGLRLLTARDIDDRKNLNLAETQMKLGEHSRTIAELTTKLKTEGYGIYDRALPAEAIAKKYEFKPDFLEDAIALLKLSDSEGKLIDCDDMLRLPVIYGKRSILEGLIVLDEVQDFTPNGWLFLMECLVTPSNQVLMIGDPDRQSLMQFAGAKPEIFDEMSEFFQCIPMEITRNRRCAKSIVDNATHKGNMLALEDAPNGLVSTLPVDEVLQSICDGLHANDAILSETNAPLLSLGLQLITKGVSCQMRVERIEKLIMRNAFEFLDTRKCPVGEMSVRMEAKALASENGMTSELKELIDCIRALETFCLSKGMVKPVWTRGPRGKSIPLNPIQSALRQLLGNGTGITLMTGHTAKGLEWNSVFHLPKPTTKALTEDWQLHQANCVDHVIKTRARTTFITLV